MKMNNRLLKSFVALTVCCMVLALASPSFAQGRGYSRGRAYSRADVDRLIRQAENRSDQFVAIFDRALDRSRLEGTIREDRLNERAMTLERELNIVRQQFNRTTNYYNVRSHVANALSAAQGINNVMRNRRLDPVVERQWMLLRSDLNRLAAVFNLRQQQ
jgi:hypothetical protein